MQAILDVILMILAIYKWVVIVVVLMSWLIAFNVINLYNNVARSIWNGLNALTEPVLRPIRNVLPAMGGMDLSPVVLLLLIFLIQDIIVKYIYPSVY